MFFFGMFSPTVTEWQIIARTQESELLNPRPQMTAFLEQMREDVDSQFDENQGKWRPLRPFTVAKKEEMNADMRILHETRQGQGLRLRDAYKQTGEVTSAGVLLYSYPKEKPYAREHQEGRGDEAQQRTTRGRTRRPNARERGILKKELERLDAEFLRSIGLDD